MPDEVALRRGRPLGVVLRRVDETHPSSRGLCQGLGVRTAIATRAPTRPTSAVLSILVRFASLLTVSPPRCVRADPDEIKSDGRRATAI